MEKVDRLKEYREKIAAEKAAGTYVAPVQKSPIEKNIGNTSSRTLAINAFCSQCMGCSKDHQEPNWKDDVANCTSTECALYVFRPYQPKDKPEEAS